MMLDAAFDGVDVDTVMTPAAGLETVKPGDGVVDAFESLGENEIGRLPVVDSDGSLQRLLTWTDPIRAFRIVTEQRRSEDEVSEVPDV